MRGNLKSAIPEREFKNFSRRRDIQDGAATNTFEGLQRLVVSVVGSCSLKVHWRAAKWAMGVRSIKIHCSMLISNGYRFLNDTAGFAPLIAR